jgi:CBS domain-containing protein
VVAEGRDPSEVTAGELGQGKPVTIGADDSVQEAIDVMKQHGVRRLPVIDGHELVGIVSQGDIAAEADDEETGRLLEAISTAP